MDQIPALTLDRELTVVTLASQRNDWLSWFTQAQAQQGTATPLQLQAAAVDEVDSAGVQMLLSLTQTIAHAGLSWRLVNPSRVLTEACRMLGLQHLVDTPAAGDPS